jgi:hypothetical protein
MNRKNTLKVIILSLAVVMAIASVSIAFANYRRDDSNVVVYGQHGEVVLQLPQPSNATPPAPPGTSSHPTCLRLIANDFDKKSEFGAVDTLVVALWIPNANSFVPVAQIQDNSNPDYINFARTLYNNTPVWTGLTPNIICVNDNQLEVWKEDDVIMANLTMPVKITLPFNVMIGSPYATWGDQTFILPPMTLMFRPIAHGFDNHESLTLLPHPPLSGYTVDVKSWMSPAWVQASIPLWVKGAWIECSGHVCTHLTQTAIPPAT